ncbi:hypothetical protein [Vibrio alginolyticus]|uniref:hypothetical protein n=2 Tax=Vibrio harveyi group TaxID=717610 RepID=UPI001BD580DD|nr:hypothetical protein [Vibrio alginolyticus]MBT0082613.1 hypothetical protein [Vibrio alginolyticus]MBT0105859.1 hypothetical protein [Vibrio alginolyticus]
MAKAKDNEKVFLEHFKKKVPNVALIEQKSYSVKDSKSRRVSSSVDFYFEVDDHQVLIEIDSYNMAKVVVGQYILLNQLKDHTITNPMFLVIHTYKGYNPERTVKYLDYINETNQGYFPYGVIHIEQLEKWNGGSANEFIALFNRDA